MANNKPLLIAALFFLLSLVLLTYSTLLAIHLLRKLPATLIIPPIPLSQCEALTKMPASITEGSFLYGLLAEIPQLSPAEKEMLCVELQKGMTLSFTRSVRISPSAPVTERVLKEGISQLKREHPPEILQRMAEIGWAHAWR